MTIAAVPLCLVAVDFGGERGPLSRVLGHHSASFTLDVYVHLLEGEEAEALDLSEALARGQQTGNGRDRIQTISDEKKSTEMAL